MSESSKAGIALACVVPAPSVGILVGLYWVPGALGSAVWSASKVWLIAVPLLWWLLVDRGSWSASPLKDRAGWMVGLVSGGVIAATILGVNAVWGAKLIEPESLRELAEKNHFADKGAYLGLAASLTFINSLVEEYVWRWFVYTKSLALLGSRGVAVVASALFFTIHHTLALIAFFNVPVVLLGSCGVFAGSVIWSGLYARYGSIWPGYVSHIGADLAIFWLGWQLLF